MGYEYAPPLVCMRSGPCLREPSTHLKPRRPGQPYVTVRLSRPREAENSQSLERASANMTSYRSRDWELATRSQIASTKSTAETADAKVNRYRRMPVVTS